MCDLGSLTIFRTVRHPSLALPGRKEQATEDKCDESRFCKHACWKRLCRQRYYVAANKDNTLLNRRRELYSASLLEEIYWFELFSIGEGSTLL